MANNKRQTIFLPFLFYLVGLFAGLFLIFIAAWADMEASFYGFPRQADPGLTGFHCPVLMTRTDMDTLSFSFTNTTDVKLSPSVKVWVSSPALPDVYVERVELEPGESQQFEWRVGPGNIDLQRFIFAQALVYSSFPLPTQLATCGIYILDLPVSGKLVLWALIILCLAGMSWGLFAINRIRSANEWIRKYFPALVFLAVVLVVGLVFSMVGAWVQSTLVLAAIALLLFILLGSLLMTERRKVL